MSRDRVGQGGRRDRRERHGRTETRTQRQTETDRDTNKDTDADRDTYKTCSHASTKERRQTNNHQPINQSFSRGYADENNGGRSTGGADEGNISSCI